jgi:TonB family protein
MFDTLIESRPRPLGLSRWGIVGAVGLHVAAFSAALRTPTPALAAPPPIVLESLPAESAPVARRREPVPPIPVPPSVQGPILPLPPVAPIPGLPDLIGTALVVPDRHPGVSVDSGVNGDSTPLAVWLVQERPELLAGPPPVYPASLRELGVEGLVVIQVVVDTLGRPEPGSVRIVRHSAPGFETAAVASILGARFRPARVWGRAVRVLVQVPVEFRLQARR